MRIPLFIALIALPLCLFAETITVTVTDRDLEIPLEGVTVTLRPQSFETVTDENGIALIELPEDTQRAIVFAELPGYQSQRVSISSADSAVAISLSITDVIEGSELVVERSAPGKKDEQSGISVAMDKSEMDTTANLGLVEDIMSSIKTLPGMSYSGGFDAQPSIRGGYPDEMGTVMDGVYIPHAFHWGNGYSIFNPNMVESAKMSHGVFSARYGRALSGLLEVTTVQPDAGEFRFIGGISTTSLDFFTQTPIGENTGIFLGGKITYLESLAFLNDEVLDSSPKLRDTIPTMPYIRDFYVKFYHEHSPTLNVGLNAFIGSDGIGITEEETNDDITTALKFNWDYVLGFVAFTVNWMPTDQNTVRFLGAWNITSADVDFAQNVSGTREYSDAFISEYGSLLGGKTEYTLDGLDLVGESTSTTHQLQAKIESDILIQKNHVITFGAEEIFHSTDMHESFSGWFPMEVYEPDELRYNYYTLNTTGNRIIHSAAFALWSFGTEKSPLRGEIGIRGEHFYLWNTGFDVKTMPVGNPRGSLHWTPIQNRGIVDSVTFSVGSGIFSQFPFLLSVIEEKHGIDDYELGPDQAWFQVVGIEAQFPQTWSVRLEGYYKYYLSRLYGVGYYNELTGDTDFHASDNGKGYTAGFDLMIRKKQGRYFDGYLSYSFIYSQFKNPMEPRGDVNTTIDGDPLDEWYYPSFHRFHTLNLVLNWRPTPSFTVTLTSTLATGSPRSEIGDIEMAPTLYKGEVIERYRRSSFYSDTLRNDISCPVNLRFSYSNYYTNSKIRWEYYVGIEDIFVNLYEAKSNPGFDPYTGKEIKDSDSADFSIGIPILSVGYKISY